jgi:hypothetical protein
MNQAVRYSLRALAGTLLMFAFNVAVAPQCAMCRASLSGSNNARFVKYLNVGVLVLLTPPVAMFCAVFVILKRHANRRIGDESRD